MRPEHWMMFSTFAEQDHFIYPCSDAYAGVIINANMAAHAPSGLASFIIEKLSTDTKYIVDPITHAFQHDPIFIKNGKTDEVKTSIRLLAEKYGSPIVDRVGKEPLQPLHLDSELVSDFAERVLEFQRNHLRAYMLESEAAKYLDGQDIKSPAALVAPYFYMTETGWRKWLPVNLDCIEVSLKHLTPEEKLFAEIVIDKGIILDEEIQESIIDGYKKFKGLLTGCLIWFDNFDEQEVSIAELRAMKNFLTRIKEFIPEIINLHGGYFSVMLGGEIGGICLTGVTHGPEFGEFRSVVPVGGGIPIARYYVPRLHSRMRYREALDIFSQAGWLNDPEAFHQNVCNCPECISVIDHNPDNFTIFGAGEVKTVKRRHGMVRIEFPYTETKNHCLRHYLQRKHREYQMVDRAPSEVILTELNKSIEEFESLAGPDGTDHLLRWREVLVNK